MTTDIDRYLEAVRETFRDNLHAEALHRALVDFDQVAFTASRIADEADEYSLKQLQTADAFKELERLGLLYRVPKASRGDHGHYLQERDLVRGLDFRHEFPEEGKAARYAAYLGRHIDDIQPRVAVPTPNRTYTSPARSLMAADGDGENLDGESKNPNKDGEDRQKADEDSEDAGEDTQGTDADTEEDGHKHD